MDRRHGAFGSDAPRLETPAFRVVGRLFARFHRDGESLAEHTGFDARQTLIRAGPDRFSVTDHHRRDRWILLRLDRIAKSALREVLEQAWRERAPRSLVGEWDA